MRFFFQNPVAFSEYLNFIHSKNILFSSSKINKRSCICDPDEDINYPLQSRPNVESAMGSPISPFKLIRHKKYSMQNTNLYSQWHMPKPNHQQIQHSEYQPRTNIMSSTELSQLTTSINQPLSRLYYQAPCKEQLNEIVHKPATHQDGRGRKRKRPQIVFSPQTVRKLQEVFIERKYLNVEECEMLGKEIGVTGVQVDEWFRNKSQKWISQQLTRFEIK